MSENHSAIIARVKVTPHPNPEVHSLAVGEVCGETVIVSKSCVDDTLGIYFSCDLQLSPEFCGANDLIRRKCPETGKNLGGMFDANRKVRAQTFQGIKSYGFWAPLSYLEKAGVDISKLSEGDYVDTIQDIPICCKYESPEQLRAKQRESRKKPKGFLEKLKIRFFGKDKPVHIFPEHKDTNHFLKNAHKFKVGDDIIITEKMEGTSQRVAWGYEIRPLTILEKLFSRFFKIDNRVLRKYNGTRRTILTDKSSGGYFSESWRKKVADRITPYLKPQMQVYFEVVGYEDQKTIAPRQKITDKDLRKTYGESMVYTYGVPSGEFDVYVYRISYVLDDGSEVDLPWDDITAWCTAHGVKYCPVIERFKYDGDLDKLVTRVRFLSDGPSTVCFRHIREGVCVRANGAHWTVFKNKSYDYKLLAGIAQEQVGFVDPEDLS